MSRKYVYDKLKESGLPVAHMCFPESAAPPLPFVVFYTDEDDTFIADNSRYTEAPIWTVELYEASASETTEKLLENKIAELGAFERVEQWIEDEKCLMIAYRFKSMRG